jgi:predicted DNA-binding transcriptional regulator YafY
MTCGVIIKKKNEKCEVKALKSDRLLSALLLLQAHGRMTGRALAERLEVSQRTMHRDMEALSAAGVPVMALRGAQGGWQLEKGWRTQVPGLDVSELRALLMAQPRALREPRLAAAAERAMGKLLASLPGNMREQAAAMRERLHVDANDWRPVSEDLSMLPAVQDAVARDCRLSFDYTRADGESGLRIVDPLGLVVKGVAWYLVARTPRGMRTYRVSRMRTVMLLAVSFQRPARFDLAKHWQRSVTELQGQRRSYEATLLLSPRAAESLIRWCVATPAGAPIPEDAPAGWLAMHVDFESEEQALFVVLGLGVRARVLEPAALFDRVMGEAMVVAEVAQVARNARYNDTSLG